MKSAVSLLLLFVSILSCSAGQRLSAAAWDKVQFYSVAELERVKDLKINQVVAIRFRNRSDQLRHLKPNWYQAALWQPETGARRGYASIPVMVAKQDVSEFKKLPSDFHNTITLVIYGRVLREPASRYTFVRLYGTDVTLDDAGNATIDWSASLSVSKPSPHR